MAKKIDATQGNLIKFIFAYTIPLIIGTEIQTMFTLADKAVLGNMAGSTAVAAIGATSGTVTSLIINGALGLATGVAIILARAVGQKDAQKIRQTIDTSLLSAVGIGVIVSVVGYFFTPVILTFTKCPSECYNDAMIYMRIYLLSAPATFLYKYGSHILQVLGDTRRPLFYIMISGVVNVALNVILCLILPQKVVAVAIATVVSNALSAVLLIWRLCHLEEDLRLRLGAMRFKLAIFIKILRFGLPSSISNLVLPLGNLQIATTINTFGVDAVAGSSASASITSIVENVSAGFSSAATTFIGQNLGAKNKQRVKSSFWYLLLINTLITGSLGIVVFMSGRFWIGLIVGASATVAIDFGMIRMLYVTSLMFISAANRILTSSLQAFGYPILVSITNIFFNLGFRVLWMNAIYPRYPEFSTIMLCFPVSWVLNMLFYAIFFAVVYLRYTKKNICKKI